MASKKPQTSPATPATSPAPPKRRKSGPSGKSRTIARYREEGYLQLALWLPPELIPVLDRLAAIHGDRTKAICELLRSAE